MYSPDVEAPKDDLTLDDGAALDDSTPVHSDDPLILASSTRYDPNSLNIFTSTACTSVR